MCSGFLCPLGTTLCQVYKTSRRIKIEIDTNVHCFGDNSTILKSRISSLPNSNEIDVNDLVLKALNGTSSSCNGCPGSTLEETLQIMKTDEKLDAEEGLRGDRVDKNYRNSERDETLDKKFRIARMDKNHHNSEMDEALRKKFRVGRMDKNSQGWEMDESFKNMANWDVAGKVRESVLKSYANMMKSAYDYE